MPCLSGHFYSEKIPQVILPAMAAGILANTVDQLADLTHDKAQLLAVLYRMVVIKQRQTVLFCGWYSQAK